MDLNIFEKLKEIYEGIRKAVWYLVPLGGLFVFLRWFFFEWIPARAKQFLGWLVDQLPVVEVDPSTVAIAWERVNQWVPLNEALSYGAIYIGLAGSLAIVKWVRKLLPFG